MMIGDLTVELKKRLAKRASRTSKRIRKANSALLLLVRTLKAEHPFRGSLRGWARRRFAEFNLFVFSRIRRRAQFNAFIGEPPQPPKQTTVDYRTYKQGQFGIGKLRKLERVRLA
jgi:hypothetical protein